MAAAIHCSASSFLFFSKGRLHSCSVSNSALISREPCVVVLHLGSARLTKRVVAGLPLEHASVAAGHVVGVGSQHATCGGRRACTHVWGIAELPRELRTTTQPACKAGGIEHTHTGPSGAPLQHTGSGGHFLAAGPLAAGSSLAAYPPLFLAGPGYWGPQ